MINIIFVLEGKLKRHSTYLRETCNFIDKRIDNIRFALIKENKEFDYAKQSNRLLNEGGKEEIKQQILKEINNKILYKHIELDDIIVESFRQETGNEAPNWKWEIPNYKITSEKYICVEILLNQTTAKPLFICYLDNETKDLLFIESGYDKIIVSN